jgi:hypothetical protein
MKSGKSSITNLPTVPPSAAAAKSFCEVAEGGGVGGQVASINMVWAVQDQIDLIA